MQNGVQSAIPMNEDKKYPLYWPTYEQLVLNEEKPDDEMCLTFIFANRYSYGNAGYLICPGCEKVSFYKRVSKKKNERLFGCGNRGCRHTMLPLEDTFFHYKKSPLSDIFHIIFLLTNDPKMSTAKIAEEIDCTWVTARSLKDQILDIIT